MKGYDLMSPHDKRLPGYTLVCDRCGSRACLEGDLMCDEARRAGSTTRAEWERWQKNAQRRKGSAW